MILACNCSEPAKILRLEADYFADPSWCHLCGYNLDLGQLPLSESLKGELMQWVLDFPNEEHNQRGEALLERVRAEVGKDYSVVFIPFNPANSVGQHLHLGYYEGGHDIEVIAFQSEAGWDVYDGEELLFQAATEEEAREKFEAWVANRLSIQKDDQSSEED